MFNRVTRFFANAAGMTKAILSAVVMVIVIIMLDIYVVGNDNILNSQTSIGAVVVPIIQAALLIAAILGAISVIYFAATHSLSSK